MLKHIWEDEQYPVYGLGAPIRKYNIFDVPDELVERYEKAEAEWDAVQKELENIVYPGRNDG